MMKDERKTKAQLIEELHALRRQVSKASEETYHSVLDNMEEGYYEVDLTGCFTFFNHSMSRLLGYPEEEMMGMSHRRFMDKDAARSVFSTFNSVYKSGLPAKCFDVDIVRRDGEKIIVEVSISLIKDSSGEPVGFRGVVRDVTERKRIEQALMESNEVFRLLFEKSGDANVLLEGERYIDCNEAALRMTGCSDKETLVGLTPADLSPERQPDGLLSSEKVKKMIEIAYRDGTHRFEWRRKRLDGAEMYLDVVLTVVPIKGKRLLYTTWRDITRQKETEFLYKTLVNSSQTSIYILQDGRFRVVNPHSARYSGFSERELIDAEALDFVHPEDRDRVRACAVDMLKGERSSPYEYRIFDRSGCIRHLVETVTPISFEGRRAVLGNTMDITFIKEMEQSLLDSEKRYRTIFENTGAATVIVEEDATISLANTEFANLTGYTREEIEGKKKWTEFVAKKDLERMLTQHRLRRTDRDRALRTYEFDLVDKTGRVRNVLLVIDILPGTSKSVASLLDITERKQMENVLRESEEKYRVTVENALEPILVVQDGVIKFANEAVLKRAGYSAEELRNIPFLDFIHPDDREAIADRHRRRLSGENVPNRYEVKCIDNRGEILYLLASTVSIQWEGRPALLVFTVDITEKRQLEAQLHRAQRMEAIGTLAGGIAHDFNNILSAIMGYTEMAMDDLPKDGRDYEYLTKVFRASERARELVRQILDFSRQGEHELRPLMIAPLIKESVRLLRASLPATIKIVQNIRVEDDLILVDPTQIHQVLMNLCTNAAHAMRERGGTLTISLTDLTVMQDDLAAWPDLKPGPYAVLAVSDTGHGIDPAIMGRIFDPFFTTKVRGEGTGMGLSVAHGIVKSHEGHIHVESNMAQGATFYVYLPILAEKKTDLLVEGKAPAGGGGERILVVDDEREICELIRDMLTDLGYSVTSRIGSLEALELFKADARPYDLVITDEVMPDMTGMELARALLEIRPDIPIILCTGFSERATPEMVKAAGVKALIMKPILQRRMAETIRQVLESTKTGVRESWDES